MAYVDESEVDLLIWELQRKGYVVREGTMAQLELLAQASAKDKPSNQRADVKGNDPSCTNTPLSKQPDSPRQDEGNGETEQSAPVGSVPCSQEPASEQYDQEERASTEFETGAEPEDPSQTPQPSQQPATHPQATIGVHADVSYGSHGHSGDAAKVFFLVAGIVVVAAFIVYAGNYVVDIVRGEDYQLWWEVIFNSTFLSADSGRHGDFYGAKIATGFVSNELFQLALVGEVGNADINLMLNRDTNPQRLDYSASYWLLGGAARLHLTDAMVNASYLYMEFMGGTTNESSTGTISVARVGASFGIGDTLRLGASYGAQYIGLNEDEGFTNDDDNYWFTLGVEIGARF
ncbi:MAG: hypothetical protein PVH04_09210 [Gammaproteobacteria bacterium]